MATIAPAVASYSRTKISKPRRAADRRRDPARPEPRTTSRQTTVSDSYQKSIESHPLYKLGHTIGVANSLVKKAAARMISRAATYVAMSWWIAELILYGVFISLFGAGFAFSAVAGPVLKLFGADGSAGVVFFGGALGISFLSGAVSLTLLFTCYLIYRFSDIHSLSGKMQLLKIGLFIVAFLGYMVPFLQFAPWALPWLIVVGRNPE